MGGDFCRNQFPAAMNRTGAAPDRKLSAIVSFPFALPSYPAGQETH